MSNSLFEDSAGRLAVQADAIGQLAKDAGAFAAAFAAFEARDPDAFRWVLTRVELWPRCELICEWIQIKLCTLRCIRVCGIPVDTEKVPPFTDFAKAAMKLAENEGALRRAVDAVSCGDAEAWSAVIDELKLRPFCHLLCRWVCSAIWRRFCEVVCRPGVIRLPDPVVDLRQAAAGLAEVVKHEKVYAAVVKGAEALDCIRVRTQLTEAKLHPHCEWICWLFCVWRCHWICRELCRRPVPILEGVDAVEEAREFALAARQLAGQARPLGDLVAAVNGRNAEAYGAIIDRFGLWPFCWQVCGWVCAVTCSEFCFCICPPPALRPWWTAVHDFSIISDIDPGTGRTNKVNPVTLVGGGPNYAFYSCLELRGFCPAFSPDVAGEPMKYRFTYDDGSVGAPFPITGALACPVEAGSRTISWPTMDGVGNATAALQTVTQLVVLGPTDLPADLPPPVAGSPWYGPSPHHIKPDGDGWVLVDPDAVGGGFQNLLGFASDVAVPGGAPGPAGLNAGDPLPAGTERNGTNLKMVFEATRVSNPAADPPDYSQTLNKIRINNWVEVDLLNFKEYATGCCTPIDKTLSVQFTVDHEEMDAGSWSLVITSCALGVPKNITPHLGDPGVTLGPRGGFGTIVENTSTWANCSYTVTLNTTPALTDGHFDRGTISNSLTFAICSHKQPQ
jgi:hypothetical protein